MRLEEVKTNECSVVVEPRYAGNYGSFSIGGMKRTPEEEYALCSDIAKGIKKHVDDIQNITIEQKIKYKFNGSDNVYESIEDALIDMFQPEDYEERVWVVHGKYNNKEKYDTRTYCYSFNELVRAAYDYPYGFEIISGEVSKQEMCILDRTIEFRLR